LIIFSPFPFAHTPQAVALFCVVFHLLSLPFHSHVLFFMSIFSEPLQFFPFHSERSSFCPFDSFAHGTFFLRHFSAPIVSLFCSFRDHVVRALAIFADLIIAVPRRFPARSFSFLLSTAKLRKSFISFFSLFFGIAHFACSFNSDLPSLWSRFIC